MKRTEELFSLIHSLDKHEKRFFKLSASIEGGEKQYMQMFDILCKQSVYDEKEIMSLLKINKNVLAFQKNYLLRLILDCMGSYHTSPEADVRKFLTQADLLYQKGLYSLHKKILGKAKDLANKYEMNNYLREILSIENQDAWQNYDKKRIHQTELEEKKILAVITNENEYREITAAIFKKLSVIGNVRNKKEISELKKLMRHPIIRNESRAISLASKELLYNTLGTCSGFMGDVKKQYTYCRKRAALYATRPERKKRASYLMSINNLIHTCFELKLYDEIKQNLDELAQYSGYLRSEREKAWTFFCYHFNNMLLHIKTGRFEEYLPHITAVQQEMKEHESSLNALQQKMFMHFNMAVIYFGCKDFDKSIEYMNKIRNEEDFNFRQDMASIVNTFYLIVHFEKGNTELLPYLTKSEQRHLQSENRLYKFEKLLLGFFGKTVPRIFSKDELNHEFRKLKAQLVSLSKDPHEGAPLKEFDYISWIESKIEGRKFSEIVKEKAR